MADQLSIKIKQLTGEVFGMKVSPEVSRLKSLEYLLAVCFRTESKDWWND